MAKIESFLTEEFLMELFSMNKEQIGVLRNQRNFPYVKLSQRKRVYYEDNLSQWLLNNRVNVPKTGDET